MDLLQFLISFYYFFKNKAKILKHKKEELKTMDEEDI